MCMVSLQLIEHMEAVVSVASYFALIVPFFINRIPMSLTQSDRSFYYDTCAPSTCGNLTITFPFSSSDPLCGLPGYEVTCVGGRNPRLTAKDWGYAIQAIYQESIVLVTDTVLVDSLSSGDCDSIGAHSLPISWGYHLTNWSGGVGLTVYSCPKARTLHLAAPPDAFASYNSCRGNNTLIYNNKTVVDQRFNPDKHIDPGPDWSSVCNRTSLPIMISSFQKRKGFVDIISGGFLLQWPKQLQQECETCEKLDGRCVFNDTTERILCFCSDGSRNCTLSGSSTRNEGVSWKVVVAIVIPSTAAVMAVLVSLAMIYRRRVGAGLFCILLRGKANRSDMDAQEFINKYKTMLPTEYSYPEIKKMTGGFKHNLGRGGYGSVFKGTSPNGIPVAVKVLGRSSGSSSSGTRGSGRSNEDFFNEVATIGRIHHVNIIRLLGFCCDGSSRALVYEFMANGSLADLLGKEAQQLTPVERLRISVEIARGIEYLHQGCDSRILHLDIKPQNVLLDQHLHAKISDFGLSKSYSRKDSVVRLTRARGTIGFIAPEVFLHNLGGVSHKSDVYSYGMVLIEMACGKKNDYNRESAAKHPQASSSSGNCASTYFPDWVYDILDELGGGRGSAKEIVPEDTLDGSDVTVLRTMVLVGLWCIQTRPVDRPSISEALEMLTGKVESIQLPPKPVLFSPAVELSPVSTLINSGNVLSS